MPGEFEIEKALRLLKKEKNLKKRFGFLNERSNRKYKKDIFHFSLLISHENV